MDEVMGGAADLDRAADFLELAAFFASDSAATTSDLANQATIGAADGQVDVDGEMRHGEEESYRARPTESTTDAASWVHLRIPSIWTLTATS